MERKIKLLVDVKCFDLVIKAGTIFEENLPYDGFTDDGSFVICCGMDMYHTIESDKFTLTDEVVKKPLRIIISDEFDNLALL